MTWQRSFYIDENLTPALKAPLSKIFTSCTFRTPADEHMIGVQDIELFDELRERDYDAIITGDARQLERVDERDGLRKAGLHWIGFSRLRSAGQGLLSLEAATILGGLPHVLSNWADTPTAYLLRSANDQTPSTTPL